MKDHEIKKAVRQGYAKVARRYLSGRGCCQSVTETIEKAKSCGEAIGYTKNEVKEVSDGEIYSFGCGNPVALASLKKGETVLDLGSGLGFDCFLAAKRVGKNGRVIGVDMTSEMIDKARENAQKMDYKNVEFRLGEIENLPAVDNSIDVIISNCVINLSVNKKQVFQEAYRVLKRGGRIMISDLVLLKELPTVIKDSIRAYVGCLAGAMLKHKYLKTIKEVGFVKVKILQEKGFPIDYMFNDATVPALSKGMQISDDVLKEIGNSVLSISIFGIKP